VTRLTATDFAALSVIYRLTRKSGPYAQKLVLCHYALRSRPGSRRGAVHLYGHSHGTLPGNGQSLDVGVDCWDFRPVSLSQIREVLEREPPAGMVP
jgi:calcineurin-like phosphoesterase family protein